MREPADVDLGRGGSRQTRRDLFVDAGVLGLASLLAGALTGGSGSAGRVRANGQNVLVVVIDSLRSDHVGAYGGRGARTPNLDALARQSLVFDRVRHEAMPTVPVRKALMVGRSGFPFRGWRPVRSLPSSPGWEGVGDGEVMFTDVLRRAGYTTGYVTDNPHILRPAFAPFRRRFDVMTEVEGQVPGFRLRRRPVSERRLRRHTAPELRGADRGRVREYLAYNGPDRAPEDYLAARVFAGAIDFVERAAARERSFALVVDCFDVHEPWDPPPGTHPAGRGSAERGGYRPVQPFPTPVGDASRLSRRTLGLMRRLYAAEVTFLDAWLGRMLRRLDELGLADETWVVVVSDHGVMLGEHGIVGKTSAALYGELLDVPLMIRHPRRVGAGRRSGYFASAHDVAPTLLRGLGAPVPSSMDGVDLRPLLRGERLRGRETWTAAWAERLLAGDGRWLLIAENDGGRLGAARLYDTQRDPRERRDLAARRPDLVRRFYGEIRRAAGPRGLPRL